MGGAPLVTVGISFRNAQATLAMAIRSVQRQTFPDFELLLVDDGSSDGSAGIAAAFAARDPRIHLAGDGRTLGLPARLNQITQHSRGRYIARMDADDLCFPERLTMQLALLTAHPELSLVGGRALVFRDQDVIGRLPFHERHEQIIRSPGSWIPLIHPTWFARREWFLRFPYHPRFRKAQDQELLLRALNESRFQCSPEPVLAYRQDHLSLRKILATRYHHGYALAQTFLRNRKSIFLLGFGTQAAKMMVDALAIGSGLRYRLLAHRRLPLEAGDQAAFAALWASVQDPSCAA